MPFLDEHGVETFWKNAKNRFARWVDASSSENEVKVELKNGWNPEDNKNVEVLDSATIPLATTTSAGVMSKEDKSKLNGIANGATANIGTITEVKTTSPLSGSATSGSVTVSHSDSGVAIGTYGTTATTAVEPSFGGTFSVPGVTVNATGHVTAAGAHTVKIPSSAASETTAGLMSAADKKKLNGVAEGATANTGTIEGITSTGPIVGSGTSGTVALSHASSGVTAGTYGDTAATAQTPEFGDIINVPGIAVNATGHVTSAGSHTVTIPENEATVDTKGLMSSDDKSKLNGIEVGATKNTPAQSTVTADKPSAVSSAAAVGTSSKYARADHVHNIAVGAGDANGQVKIAGQNASVTGLKSAAYTESSAYAAASHTHTIADVTNLQTSLDAKAPLASPELTGTPTAPTAAAGTNTTQIATTAFVKAAVDASFEANDAMLFKGTLGTGGTVTSLPASHKQGWTYKVITAGTYAGVKCEVGDMIICITDGTSANNSHWTVVQSNIDGAVTGPTSSVADQVAVFDGTTGKVIKDSGKTLGVSVPADAKFTDTVYTHPSYTARTGKPTANQTPAFGGTATVSQITSDDTGHVTGMTDRTIKIPDTVATTSTPGLMSADDKTSLNAAYAHSVTNKGIAKASGLYKITTNSEGHVTAATAATKSDIGLGNVENKSSATIRGELTSSDVETALGYTPADSADAYVHPTATAHTAAAVKVGNDALGHVVLGDALTPSDVGAAASTHTHAISDVTDLQTTLNGKAASSHAHGNITNGGDITATAPTIASGDKLIINDESASKITNGPSFGTSTTTYLRNDGTWGTPAGTYSLPNATASTKGGVTLSDDVDGTEAAASGAKAATPKAVSDALQAAKDYADEVAEGLDTGVTGVKGNAETTYRKGNVNLTPANIGAAASTHTHAISDVTNLQTTLNGKAASSHTHSISDVTNLQTSLDAKAPLASPALTGTPTAPTAANGTNTTQIATTAFVQNAFQANDAMVFKGTIGTGGTVTELPATHYQGWTYKVITAGSYAGQQCEIGDMIICVTDGTSANNAHWTVVQSNVDGVVTGPASSTDAHVAIFNGATGKVIKDSGFTIGKSVPSDAVFTDTDTKVTAAGNHYTPAENTASALNASGATGTAGSTVQVVTGIKRDAKGHVTGIVSGAATDTDTKVTSVANHYAPAKDSSSTLTASGATGTSGSTVQVITGIERDAKGHVTGIVSGAATDTNTDTKVTSAANHYSPAKDSSSTLNASGATGTSGSTVQVVTGIERDAKGHVTGIISGAATDTNTDTKVTSAANHYAPAEDTSSALNASGATGTAGATVQVVTGIKRDAKGHVVGIVSGAAKDTDTHYASSTITGTSATATSNGAVTGTGGVFLNHIENGSVKSSHKIVGSGNVTVKSDANGVVTINGSEQGSVENATNASYAAAIGTDSAHPSIGSTTQPVYVNTSGIVTAGSTYAGGTKVTLNGSDKGASTASLYAPIAAGTSGQYLKSSGSGAPAWQSFDTSISSGSTSTNAPTSAAVASYVGTAIAASDAMVFKGTLGTGGTITELPTSGVSIGDTYRVITGGDYAGQTCEVGDLIIAISKTPTWTVAQTNIDGAITSISGTTNQISVTGSGTSRTIAHADVETTAAVSTAGLKKITTDGLGHIKTTADVTKSDITALGISDLTLQEEVKSYLPTGATGEYGVIYDTAQDDVDVVEISSMEPILVESILDPSTQNVPTSQAVANYVSTYSPTPTAISNATIDSICV